MTTLKTGAIHDVAISGNETLYRARWIFPISAPPIHHGFMRAINGRIVELGRCSKTTDGLTTAIDLGDVAILPKVVNAHTHLEFSDCRSPIGPKGIPLAQWIGEVIRTRGITSHEQRDENLRRGVQESIDCGVGLVGDIATPPCNYPTQSQVGIVSFAEVLGLSDDRARERTASAEAYLDSQCYTELATPNRYSRPAISPHAPYSTPPALIDRCVEMAIERGIPLAMHIAESPQERELLGHGSGLFAESLHHAGLWQEGLFPWNENAPIATLIQTLARAPRALLIHGNDLNDTEIELITRHPNLSVVYCPRTHHFFGYDPHPIDKLLKAGVRVALGTDSRASNPDLNVWREFQFLLNHRPDISPQSALRMLTESGAQALLGAETHYGTIHPDSSHLRDLAFVPTTATTLDQIWPDFADHELSCTGMFTGA